MHVLITASVTIQKQAFGPGAHKSLQGQELDLDEAYRAFERALGGSPQPPPVVLGKGRRGGMQQQTLSQPIGTAPARYWSACSLQSCCSLHDSAG